MSDDESVPSERSTTRVRSSLPQETNGFVVGDRSTGEEVDRRESFRAYRRNSSARHSEKEDKIAAFELREREHGIRDQEWDAGDTSIPPKRKEDLTTAQGRMAAAIRAIRTESKGTGKTGERIEQWMQENRQLVEDAEAEFQILPAPVDRRQFAGTAKERDLDNARKELQRIRRELFKRGKQVLNAAMRDPSSEYSQQKKYYHKLQKEAEQARQIDQTISQPN